MADYQAQISFSGSTNYPYDSLTMVLYLEQYILENGVIPDIQSLKTKHQANHSFVEIANNYAIENIKEQASWMLKRKVRANYLTVAMGN